MTTDAHKQCGKVVDIGEFRKESGSVTASLNVAFKYAILYQDEKVMLVRLTLNFGDAVIATEHLKYELG